MTCRIIELDHEQLMRRLRYERDTGVFTWNADGRPAGCRAANGYLIIGIDGRLLLAHRLAWFYEHGRWPLSLIDHADGNRLNNRISNLREATKTQNINNSGARSTSSSGVKGVSWDKRNAKWRATITVNGKQRSLGRHARIEDAAAAYANAAIREHGDFLHVATEPWVTFYDLQPHPSDIEARKPARPTQREAVPA